MKVRSAVKRICGYCQIVRRGNVVYNTCRKFGKHKQRQGFSTLDRNLKMSTDFCHCEEAEPKILQLSEFENLENKKI
jgi:large subunit ribosomal protein L36